MPVVTGDRYLESLVKFLENQAESLIEGSLVLKLNPVGLRYVQSRLEALQELEGLLHGAPVDYLRAYISDLGDHRALEQLRKILNLLPSLKVVSLLTPLGRDPTPLNFLSFGRLKVLELRCCDLSTSAAKGLLELRFTLEKFVCYNSTDALRHAFTSRIADVKDSPQWNRLSFVSFACNGLVLMDDSLQLLPVVEFLDLSRNKFTKVDNLNKCTKLKHLDLGFNNLRAIASFGEVCCQIEKLVLRNNALMSLRGIENLKSLQGLDLSYNVLSSFSEIERLSGLPSLQSLWLEGNPLCYARWFRAQVFCLFPHPDQLILDEKKISSSEFWKHNIIIASRMTQPASFGFYCPATDDVDVEGGITKRKRASRLASIKNVEQIFSDQDSSSCDNENKDKDENDDADEEAEIEDLMRRIEVMKKDDSVSWLEEFKEWMTHKSQDVLDGNKFSRLPNTREHHHNSSEKVEEIVETSRCIYDFHHSGDGSSSPNLDSGTSFADTSTVASGQLCLDETHLADASVSRINFFVVPKEDAVGPKILVSLPAVINDIMGPRPLSASLGSPPHYQEDILHRRNNFEEEFMQICAESASLASSDSNSSCSLDDLRELRALENFSDGSIADNLSKHVIDPCGSGSYPEAYCSINQFDAPTHPKDCIFPEENTVVGLIGVKANWRHQMNCRQKIRKRTVHLVEDGDAEASLQLIDNTQKLRSNWDEGQEITLPRGMSKSVPVINGDCFHFSETTSAPSVSISGKLGLVEMYFNVNLNHSSSDEIVSQHIGCTILISDGQGMYEREVALVRSSEKKLYILVINSCEGSEISLENIGSHAIDTIQEISVGLGLQVMRVSFEGNAAYLFITRCSQRSRELLYFLGLPDFLQMNISCSLTSLEQIQMLLFEKHVHKGSEMNLWQYSMVLVSMGLLKEPSWSPKSLFVLEKELLLCKEDFTQWSHIDDGFSPHYFLPESSCALEDLLEIVVEEDARVVTIRWRTESSSRMCGVIGDLLLRREARRESLTWRLKWFCSDCILSFVALVKALYAQATSSSLPVRYHAAS